MKSIFIVGIIASLFFSCSKKCDCVPPPQNESSWQMVNRHGGIAGIDFPLTDIQQNSILTLKPGGLYSSVYTVTNTTANGTYIINSSGTSPVYVFTPKLPTMDEQTLMLTEATISKLVFWDGNADGIYTTFARR
jgi:hypothetical protein